MDENMTNPLDARAIEIGEMNQQTADLRDRLSRMPKKIDSNVVAKANEILRKYKEGKGNLEKKVIANEEFWKLRQWKYFRDENPDAFNPATAWLWYMIQSRYSDAMDSYPTCNIKARQQDDVQEAEKLSSIIPVVMEQNRFEDTFSDMAWDTLRNGGGIYGVFWDASKHNGLGDIAVKEIDLLNIFWEAGVTDIQQSENVFTTELVSNHILEQMYPQTRGKLGSNATVTAKYLYDDRVDTTDKSTVIDWYYHTYENGKKTLQYCKFVNDIVLYATENEVMPPTGKMVDEATGLEYEQVIGDSLAVRGLYDHGKYPFVVQSLYPIKGSIIGYGLTDIGRDTQVQLDLMNKAILENTLAGAKPRNLVKDDGTVNMDELRDINCDVIHVTGGDISEAKVRTLDYKSLDGNYLNVYMNKITELKQVTSNQDVNNGINPSGVTAGSAISALQEVAGKNARSTNKEFHRAYRDVIYQVIELIRQFYTLPRTFRITGDMGDEYTMFSNEGIRPQVQMMAGIDMGLRLPEFDIDVTSEKASPYKKMEQNELAINFYNLGFFNPQQSTMALACLDMMDFEGKDDVVAQIRQNGTLFEMLLRYQQMALELAQATNPNLAAQIGEEINRELGGMSATEGKGMIDLDMGDATHPYNARARAEARRSTQVD